MTIHKEGYPTLILSLLFLTIANMLIHQYLPSLLPFFLVVSLGLYVFLVSFFRSPNRNISSPTMQDVLAPCDGKVVVIEKVFEPEYLKSECLQVSIFMSPLNVHVNWHPVSGEILYSKYHPGKFLAAWHPKAATENERTTVSYTVNGQPILVRQVAGALARRIVCYANQGQKAVQGAEMGFIKFGSRMDLYLPLDFNLQVNIDQKVTGNRSVIGSWA